MSDATRLREPTFLILAALERPRHGYGILQAVEATSLGRVRLRAGTLYAALDRLVVDGLVQVSGEEVVDGRLRRYYAVTTAGRELLAAEAHVWQGNLTAASWALRRGPKEGLA